MNNLLRSGLRPLYDRQNWTWRQATEPDEDGWAHDTAPPQEAPKDFTNAIVDVDTF
jgi:hypothetical protein